MSLFTNSAVFFNIVQKWGGRGGGQTYFKKKVT